jgi:thioredoxin reductase (NADPH)
MSVYDVVIVGSGPAGLATAIAAKQHGLRYLVVEKGALVNTLLHFPTNMVFFTTPELLEIGGLPFVTPYDKPTRLEALRYYRRVVDTYTLAIDFDETVAAIESSAGERGGPASARRLRVRTTSTRRGARAIDTHTAVIATGAYDLPNPLEVEGEALPHVSHYYTEAHPWYRKRVVIIGGANSAADAALELYRGGAHVTIVHRGADFGQGIKYWVRPDLLNRVKEGSIAARLESRVVRITPDHVETDRLGVAERLPADGVFVLTGYHSDTTLLASAGVRFDPVELTPSFDADTFETNVPGIYLAGNVTTGRQTNRIFIENGRFHGERVIQVIASRLRGTPDNEPRPVLSGLASKDAASSVEVAAASERPAVPAADVR